MIEESDKDLKRGILITSILGIIGGLILFFTGAFNVTTYEEFNSYLNANKIFASLGLFLLGIALFFLILISIKAILKWKKAVFKPKEKTLYLLEIKNYTSIFIDENGKEFSCFGCKHQPGRYYYVLKTHDKIEEVLGESLETFTINKVKERSSSNFSLKSKKQKSDLDYYMLKKFISFLLTIVINIILFVVFIKLPADFNRLVLAPFFLGISCVSGYIISLTSTNGTMASFFLKCFVIIFLLLWFGFLSFFTIKIVEQENDYRWALFTVPFWIFGIGIFYFFIIKKR